MEHKVGNLKMVSQALLFQSGLTNAGCCDPVLPANFLSMLLIFFFPSQFNAEVMPCRARQAP